MKSILLTVVVMLGVVDQIYEDYALIEYESPAGEVLYIDVPIEVIPCKVAEGDLIRFSRTSERTKIICSN